MIVAEPTFTVESTAIVPNRIAARRESPNIANFRAILAGWTGTKQHR